MSMSTFAIPQSHYRAPLAADNGSAAYQARLLRCSLPDASSDQGSAAPSVAPDRAIGAWAGVANGLPSDMAHFDALAPLFRAIGHSSSITDLISVLAAETSQLIKFGFTGCGDDMNTMEWQVAVTGEGIEIEAITGHTMTDWGVPLTDLKGHVRPDANLSSTHVHNRSANWRESQIFQPTSSAGIPNLRRLVRWVAWGCGRNSFSESNRRAHIWSVGRDLVVAEPFKKREVW